MPVPVPERRFVILHHVMPAGSERPTHWDLMLELAPDAPLITWALDDEPLAGRRIRARQLPPHRRLYLDYEGPVSGGRGTVKRWDAGSYELLRRAPTAYEIRLTGRQLPGVVVQFEAQDAARELWLVTLGAT